MLSVRYITTVLAITAATIIAGIVLWNSEESQTLESELFGGWSRGPNDAPIVLETFVDFT